MKKSVLQNKSRGELIAHAAELKAQIAQKTFALRAGGNKHRMKCAPFAKSSHKPSRVLHRKNNLIFSMIV